MNNYKTPYVDLLPPLSTEEFENLKADIKENGVRDPVLIDESGNLLDGHHRLKIAPKAPHKIIKGLSEPEAEAFAIRVNTNRRNLSPAQKKEISNKQRVIARRLRNDDPKKWTNANVGKTLGVAESTIRLWFDGNNRSTANTSAPDARVKVSPRQRPDVAKRVQKGESTKQVAADYGVTDRQIRNIVNVEKKIVEARDARNIKPIKPTDRLNLIHGDFREKAETLADNSVDLIFTDPPYDEESLPLYGDLAELAARVLKPGSWCLAYAGQLYFPQLLELMSKHLTFGWIFSVFHSGGSTRFRKFKLQCGWKPVVGFYKPELSVYWDWFSDTVSGGKSKDHHDWEQPAIEAEHFIKALCSENGHVIDPMMGSGTTGVAALENKMKFTGFEIDKDHYGTATKRLQRYANSGVL